MKFIMEHQQHKYLANNIIDQIVPWVMEDDGVDLKEALKTVYSSPIIKWLENPDDPLASQSPAYVYELLKRQRQNAQA